MYLLCVVVAGVYSFAFILHDHGDAQPGPVKTHRLHRGLPWLTAIKSPCPTVYNMYFHG